MAAPIERVAIVGATGNIGEHLTRELLRSGTHSVTALTRGNSKSAIPPGVKAIQVDYDDEHSLVSALESQQFLIITLSTNAPVDLHSRIVKAAVKAGVPYIMPNVWGVDIRNPTITASDYGAKLLRNCTEIEELGASYVVMVCGVWYEWSLALGEPFFGFDIVNRTVTLFDEGNTKVNSSTWAQCGRALAGLLQLPESGASPSVAEWKNRPLYISSFHISQRDILDSLNQVLNTADSDWDIKYEASEKRRREGEEAMKAGDMMGFAKQLYGRLFSLEGDGDFETRNGVANEAVSLPPDSLDEATKRTIAMLEDGWNPFA